MRPSAVLLALLVMGGVVCSGQDVPTDVAAPVSGAVYRIAGRVVSAMDGHALQRAQVEILDTTSRRVLASAVADEDGRFAFAALKAASYVLQGKVRGYTLSAYEHHGVYSTAIVTGAGVDTESLVLRLTPEGTISGRITDEAGEAVRHAQVSLYFENHLQGKVRIDRMRTAQTDDLGGYEMAHLPPGRYFLEATGRPWYAMHPLPPQQIGQTGTMGIVDSVDPSLDVAYGATFYPGVADPDAASAIVVKGGEVAEVELRLTPQAGVTLTIPRVLGEKSQTSLQLQKTVFGSPEQVMSEMRSTPTETTIVGLSAGKYVLKETNGQTGGEARVISVDASGRSVQVDASQSVLLGTVTVSAKMVDGSKLPAQLPVSLTPTGGGQPTGMWLNGKSEAQAKGVTPAEYRIVLSAGGYYLASAMVDGKALPGNRVGVAAGSAVEVSLVLGSGRAGLQGVATRDGKPGAGAMVLMVPVEANGTVDAFWRDQSDLDGSFRLANVPPGRYLLVAIDDGWELEWQRPEVLARYLPQGIAVVVPEGTKGALKLPLPVKVQPR